VDEARLNPDMAAVIFWVSLATVAFAYFGFPCLVILLGELFPKRVTRKPITPSISLIIAAYNEEQTIVARLNNALALDYPREALEIIVASDGSNDATEELVTSFGQGVKLLRLPRRGKVFALNAAVEKSSGEILVFSDANSMYQRRALRNLARNFADPKVGGAAGVTLYTLEKNSESSSHGENAYWNYDNWLKDRESLTGSVVSAHGGIYAIRRPLYPQLADSAVTDDFAISTAVIEQGYRLVHEGEARSVEVAVTTAKHEFSRKVRIITQGMRSLMLRKRLLNPFRYGFYSMVLFCHKVLRRMVPFFLLLLVGSTLVASPDGTFYFYAAVGQIAFYGLACAGFLMRKTIWGRSKLLYVPFFYCMANAAAMVAMLKLVAGRRIELWQPQRNQA
jgi:cellulose synthase/poly-beta-1,6-N-acetylglucosamine synthase-like glycosyltransferase